MAVISALYEIGGVTIPKKNSLNMTCDIYAFQYLDFSFLGNHIVKTST
jgi:hypothetical protein